jgi:hypothetical protein
MSGLDNATKFYIAEWHGALLLLAHSVGGIPEVVTASHPLLRVSYLSPESAASEQGMSHAKAELQNTYPLLLLALPCADGPPYRSGLIFCHNQTVNIHWTDGKHGKPMHIVSPISVTQSWGSLQIRVVNSENLSPRPASSVPSRLPSVWMTTMECLWRPQTSAIAE